MKRPVRRAVDLMLDSGAFSAWYRGEALDIKSYIKYIKEHSSLISTYVCLDHIPGETGQMGGPYSQAAMSGQEVNSSAAGSYRNQQIMKDAGLSPIPVFHMGERWEWLDRYLDDGEPYIGISPYLKAGRSDIYKWLDRCFSKLVDKSGRPLVKTHGFGATGYRLMTEYPWQTIDSTSWARLSGYGKIRVPRCGPDGSADLSQQPMIIYVASEDKPDSFANLPEPDRQWVLRYVEEMGIDFSELRFNIDARMTLAIKFLQQVQERAVGVFKSRSRSFPRISASQMSGGALKLSIVFASMAHYHNQARVMTLAGARPRLLSYFALRQLPEGSFETYVNQGYIRYANKPRISWKVRGYMDFRRRKILSRHDEGVEGEQEATT